jgi:MoxR-like ATPase
MKIPRTPPRPGVRDRLVAAKAALADALVERDDEADLALTALVAREHALLVGPPGTAKSLLLDAVARLVDGKSFTCLLTRFTLPEELFGPVSLAGLKEDRYARVTAGRLPEADVAFVDEVFKASGAVLNTLLRLLNERTFDAGGGPRPVPLRLCVAASNEWPSTTDGGGRELAAVFDLFLFRKAVRPVATAAGRSRLLWAVGHAPAFAHTLTPAEVDQAYAEATALPWTADGKEALEEVLRLLAREGVRPGDRRQRKAVTAARAAAYLAGAESVGPEHLEILRHVLWADPDGEPAACARIIAAVADPPGMRAAALLAEAEEVADAADPRDLAAAATAAAKLAEVERRLSALAGDPRGARAHAHVRERLRRLKLASIGVA